MARALALPASDAKHVELAVEITERDFTAAELANRAVCRETRKNKRM